MSEQNHVAENTSTNSRGWTKQLSRDNKGNISKTINNLKLIYSMTRCSMTLSCSLTVRCLRAMPHGPSLNVGHTSKAFARPSLMTEWCAIQ